jgi:hypothetical protein
MTFLILHLFLSAGTTLVVTRGSFLQPLRAGLREHMKLLGQLLTCPMCFGAWAGAFWAFALARLIGWHAPSPSDYVLLFFGGASLGAEASWIAHLVHLRLGEADHVLP